jgi:hypothetical protein
MNPMTVTLNSGQPYTDRLIACQLAEQMIRCESPFNFVMTKGGFHRFEFLYERDFETAKAYLTSRTHKDCYQFSA